ncbi:MAG: UPF0182 family protein [Clostridia bacterium]|nr:UPF0182 family protein [Clostridia bacterium]
MKEKLLKIKKEVNIENKIRMYLVIAVSIVTLIIGIIMFRGTYLETLEIGEEYIGVFWQNVKNMGITLVINFAIIFTSIYITNRKIKTALKEFFNTENRKMPKLLNKSISFIGAVIISALTSNFIMEKAILCLKNAQFEIQDPIFGLDIGYFVFIKPFIEMGLWYFIILIAALLIYMAIYYIATFNMFFDGVDKKIVRNSKVVKQMLILVKILSILIGLMIFFTTQNIGTDKFLTIGSDASTYSLYGAGFTDVTVKKWGYRILAIVFVISIYKTIKGFEQEDRKKIIISLTFVPIYLVLLFIVMTLFQTIFVTYNELDREKEYIQRNINYTKNAYGINVEEINLDTPTQEITTQDLENYENVINNIGIVNGELVLKDIQTSQTGKGYYSYINTQIGKYNDNLVYISPREINNSGTYNNKTYEFTHGFGTIVTSASTTKDTGNLNHVQKGFDLTNEIVNIKEPRIYFGMQTNNTVVTNTKDKKELDYVNQDSYIENNYGGKAGLKLNFIDRLILAIKEGDLKLAFSSDITSESKILTNRNIKQRAKTLMPYLVYDDNPYVVVNNEGRIIWVLDAYTISNDYPYSQKSTIRENSTSKIELNYIRNSVKVLVDSYDGTIKFYITDRTDPIVMAYRNIYPDLFVSLDEEIPSDISEHFIYPEFLYNVQADVITRYHNVAPDVLYRNDDTWQIATYNTGKVLTRTGTQIKPYYTMVKTIEETERLGLVLPYTLNGRQNLISYLVGSYDNGKAKLKIYKYEADANILGTIQLDTQLEQDGTIMKELNSLNVNGIKITKNIIIVPLENNLLYVEPIYTTYTNEADSLPILRKVIVANKNKVAIGNNLAEALSNLVSQYAVNIEIENTDTIDDLIDTIIKANHNLNNSNQSNNWEMMGKDVSKLQELITKLEQLVEENKIKNEVESQNQEIENTVNE